MQRLTNFSITLAIILVSAVQFARPAELPVSALVYPGSDGHLAYAPDDRGNVFPDFSFAGYGGGGVPLPDVPVKEILSPTGNNDALYVQAAIDRVSALPPDANGFRGAVLLKQGVYRLDSPLWIVAGGVVLRGEGSGPEDTVLTGYGKSDITNASFLHQNSKMICIRGIAGAIDIPGTARPIIDEYIPVGTCTIHVEHTRGLSVGDRIIVRRFGNEDWVRFTGMLDTATGVPKIQPPHNSERTITAIDGDAITVDIPLVCPIEQKWGGGEVAKFTDDGRIANVGVENLRGLSEFDATKRTTHIYQTVPDEGPEYYCDENHYWNFIMIDNARDCWVRDVQTRQFAGSCVDLGTGVIRATVQDCDQREHVSMLSGTRRRSFAVNGQFCLVMRCTSGDGRHDYVTGGDICGPNVFLDCTAGKSYSSSEPHGSWAYGILYDNVSADLTIRYTKRTTPVWCGAYCVLWNCERIFMVQQPPTAQNYAIGHVGEYEMIHNMHLIDVTKPRGFIEHQGTHVSPRSLYLKQLDDRLGEQALRNIGY